MEELIKKFFYTGVGVAVLTAEKLQEAVDEMVGKGKVSEEEGKQMMDDFFKKAEERRDEIEGKVKETVDKVKKGDFIPKFVSESDYSELLKRVESLEEKLGVKAEEAADDAKKVVKKTARKSTPKKS